MTACAALGALAGRMVSAHDTCTGLEGSAGLQHISITDLADRCWRAVAACQAAWALFEVLVQPKDMSVQTFRWLLTNCGTTFAAACSLMLQLCCAAAQLGPSVQQQVAASLAAAAEEVLPPLAVALHATGTVFDGSAARLPAAFKPAGLTVLLQDIIGIMQFVGATTGIYASQAVVVVGSGLGSKGCCVRQDLSGGVYAKPAETSWARELGRQGLARRGPFQCSLLSLPCRACTTQLVSTRVGVPGTPAGPEHQGLDEAEATWPACAAAQVPGRGNPQVPVC